MIQRKFRGRRVSVILLPCIYHPDVKKQFIQLETDPSGKNISAKGKQSQCKYFMNRGLFLQMSRRKTKGLFEGERAEGSLLPGVGQSLHTV